MTPTSEATGTLLEEIRLAQTERDIALGRARIRESRQHLARLRRRGYGIHDLLRLIMAMEQALGAAILRREEILRAIMRRRGGAQFVRS